MQHDFQISVTRSLAFSAQASWNTCSWQAPFWNPAVMLGEASPPARAHMKVLWLTAPAEQLLAICVIGMCSLTERLDGCSPSHHFPYPWETPSENHPAKPA